jgi:hypothetical protein
MPADYQKEMEMISVIARLSAGDKEIVEAFVKARKFWEDFFEAHKNENVDGLAKSLDMAQARFEGLLDLDRALAKEIMPTTCIAALYDETNGFADNRRLAKKVVSAFKKSMVSIEVKGAYLDDAVALYDLDRD